MIEAPRKYQACFFAHMENLRPSVETIPPLLEAFKDRGFLPTTYSELAIMANIIPTPVPRLRLASPDDEWVIEFERARINIEKKPIKPSKENLGTVEAFTQDVIDFLRRILTRFPRKGNRLALVVQESLLEIPQGQLTEMYSQILMPTDFYQQHPAVSWTSRSHTRIARIVGAGEEVLNVIMKVDGVEGEGVEDQKIVPRDRIDIEIDVNTYQVNTEHRFELETAQAFFAEATKVREELLSSLKVRLHA